MLQAAKDAASNPEVDDKTLGMLLTTVQTGMDTLTADVNAYKTLNKIEFVQMHGTTEYM